MITDSKSGPGKVGDMPGISFTRENEKLLRKMATHPKDIKCSLKELSLAKSGTI